MNYLQLLILTETTLEMLSRKFKENREISESIDDVLQVVENLINEKLEEEEK